MQELTSFRTTQAIKGLVCINKCISNLSNLTNINYLPAISALTDEMDKLINKDPNFKLAKETLITINLW